ISPWPLAISSLPMSIVLRTTTSVPAFRSTITVLKPLRMVSPVASVAARKLTPSSTAKHVAANLRLCARTFLRVKVNMTSASEGLHPLEHASGGRIVHVVDDAPVRQEHDAVRVAGGHRVVGHHRDGLAELVDRVAHEAQDLGAGTAVE